MRATGLGTALSDCGDHILVMRGGCFYSHCTNIPIVFICQIEQIKTQNAYLNLNFKP